MDERDSAADKRETRRRGTQLEAAIFQATWEELEENGYNRLTMENVAARANTSKPVLYRRFSGKGELVLAAIRSRVPTPEEEIPNTGELRADLLAVMENMNRNLKRIGPKTLHGLMVDLGDRSLTDMLFPSGRSHHTVQTILRRAEERGEVELGRLPLRILALPADLMRHEILMSYEPVSDEAIREIVDEIVLPLIRIHMA